MTQLSQPEKLQKVIEWAVKYGWPSKSIGFIELAKPEYASLTWYRAIQKLALTPPSERIDYLFNFINSDEK